MVRIPGFYCRDPGSVPSRGTEIPASRAVRPKPKPNTKHEQLHHKGSRLVNTFTWPLGLHSFMVSHLYHCPLLLCIFFWFLFTFLTSKHLEGPGLSSSTHLCPYSHPDDLIQRFKVHPSMLTAPKFISLALDCPLNSRLEHPTAYSRP